MAIHDQGAQVVLLTDGANDVRVVAGAEQLRVPVPRVAIADTIGAGDSFCGAFVAYWHQRWFGRPELSDGSLLRAATEFATAVSAVTCQRVGADPPGAGEITREGGDDHEGCLVGGQAHAAVYAQRSDVDEVVVFGRASEKLARIRDDFGFATTTDLDALIGDSSVDLVDICLPTRLHADVAVRALHAGKDVLVELPLADTLDDAARIVAAQRASGRQAFVDMFSRFSPANQRLREAVADQRYGPLKVVEIEGRTPCSGRVTTSACTHWHWT